MAVTIGPRIGIDGEAEYRKQLQNIIQQTKTLDAQMNQLASTFDKESGKMGDSGKQAELLKKKQEALTKEVDAMQQMVDKATEKYGEGSTETLKWQASLAKAQTELNSVNKQLSETVESAGDSTSALDDLTSTIEDQKKMLETLKDEYVNAVLEFGNGSDEADRLAAEITDLSSTLNQNERELSGARDAADSLGSSIEEVTGKTEAAKDAAALLGTVFGSSVSSIVTAVTIGDIVGLIGTVYNVFKDIVDAEYEMQEKWEDAEAIIVQGTGSIGVELNKLKEEAKEAWAQIAGENATSGNAAEALATLTTRMGDLGDLGTVATNAVLMFSEATGTNASDAVNGIVDVMKQFGMYTGDVQTDMETMYDIMNQITWAGEAADLSFSDMTTSIKNQAAALTDMGYSYADALALITQYRDAGGETSIMLSGLKKAEANLAESTLDIGGAMDAAISIMKNSKDTASALNTEIGSTGLTIQDVFGKNAAEQMISTFQATTGSVTDWKLAMTDSKDVLLNTYKGTISLADGAKQQAKAWSESAGISEKFTMGYINLSKYIDITGESYRKTAEAGQFAATMNAKNVNDILSGAEKSAKSVEDSTDRMKNAANITLETKWKLPTVTYDHGMDGTLSPHVSYHTYAKAMTQPYILKGATIFGAMNGSALVGGERGSEVIMGKEYLLQSMTEAVQRAFGYIPSAGNTTNNYGGATVNVYGAPGQDVHELADLVAEQINRSVNIKRALR